ncbi:hypothetical protein F5876DRAFT_70645 [Lentinula aff. lateritia]|uniref:Uncharacterized protein n=1 Tax=Lentinula aff. lateritia TaxID=2804960 RepID=A0ACC1TI67_9AGAR|nr:hypothetical protein F5876DRAFT_70645 [Lentinula aff. lateritia]
MIYTNVIPEMSVWFRADALEVTTLANFYLTTWEEYHTGFLHLGVFSGPVEGILILVVIYTITGIHGPSFWATPIPDFLHLSHIPLITNTLPTIGLNVSFIMVSGAFGLVFNILSSYANVAWLSHPKLSSPSTTAIITGSGPSGRGAFKILSPSLLPSNSPTFTIHNSALFIPFLCPWGLRFAHQVGRMILVHDCWELLSLLDPLLTALYVYTTLLISFIGYARNCVLS